MSRACSIVAGAFSKFLLTRGGLRSRTNERRPTEAMKQKGFYLTFNVIVKGKVVLALTPEDAEMTKILQDFRAFMRGYILSTLHPRNYICKSC